MTEDPLNQLLPSVPREKLPAALWVCLGLLAIFALMSYTASIQKCATFDEPLHAVAGQVIWTLGDFRVDPEDPALFTQFSALPHGAGALKFDESAADYRGIVDSHAQQWVTTIYTMYRSAGNNGESYIARSRILFLLVGISLGALIGWWAYRIAGGTCAIIAVCLFAFDPNFLAHSPLVKNDVPTSLLMLWLGYVLWQTGLRATVLRIVCIALACTAAINVKFSGLIFGAIVPTVLVIRSLMNWPWQVLRYEFRTRGARLLATTLICLFAAIISWAGTWAIYHFRFREIPDANVSIDWKPLIRDTKLRHFVARDPEHHKPTTPQLDEYPDPPAIRCLNVLDQHHLLPRAWLTGVLFTYETSIARGSFLLGNHSVTGWWYYFPLTMLFKTPMAVLGLIVVGIAGCFLLLLGVPGRGSNAWTLICICLPILLYLIPAMTTNLNLGIRHVLPVYPFIYLLIAIGLARWRIAKPQAATVVIVIGMLGLAIESISSWPNYIPFFNIASGGSRGGFRLLGDSNLDWGQDLPLLAEWQDRHPGTVLYLSYFGTVDPPFYNIKYLPLSGGYSLDPPGVTRLDRPGVVAISASNLQAIYYTKQQLAELHSLLDYLRQRDPIEVLGGSIYLFDWDPADYEAFLAKQRIP